MISAKLNFFSNCNTRAVEDPSSLALHVSNPKHSNFYFGPMMFQYRFKAAEITLHQRVFDHIESCPVQIYTESYQDVNGDNFWSVQSANRANDARTNQVLHKYLLELPLFSFERNSTPAPLLVGIETNPGPTKNKNKQKSNKNANQQSSASSSSSSSPPTSYGFDSTKKTPKVNTNDGGRSARISNRELLAGTVTVTNTITYSQYYLNPGLATTFPWCAPTANKYEQYRIHRLEVVYVPSCGTSSAGDVYLCPEYNSVDREPTDEVTLSNYDGTVVGSVWKKLTMRLNNSAMMAPGDRKFIRDGNRLGDWRIFDLGKLIVATVNGAVGTLPCGKVYLDYDIEFFIPQTDSVNQVNPADAFYVTTGPASVVCNNNATTAIPWTIPRFDPLILYNFYDSTNKTFMLPKGAYHVYLSLNINDSVAEGLYIYSNIRVNGALISGTGGSTVNQTMIAGGKIIMYSHTYVAMNGTDLLSIVVGPIGTVGGNTVSVDPYSTLTIEVA